MSSSVRKGVQTLMHAYVRTWVLVSDTVFCQNKAKFFGRQWISCLGAKKTQRAPKQLDNKDTFKDGRASAKGKKKSV